MAYESPVTHIDAATESVVLQFRDPRTGTEQFTVPSHAALEYNQRQTQLATESQITGIKTITA
jgi:hypothetical protein